jgi:hypothetical protein
MSTVGQRHSNNSIAYIQSAIIFWANRIDYACEVHPWDEWRISNKRASVLTTASKNRVSWIDGSRMNANTNSPVAWFRHREFYFY